MSAWNVSEYFVNNLVYIWDVYMSCMEVCPLFSHSGKVGHLLRSGPDMMHLSSIFVITPSYLICG